MTKPHTWLPLLAGIGVLAGAALAGAIGLVVLLAAVGLFALLALRGTFTAAWVALGQRRQLSAVLHHCGLLAADERPVVAARYQTALGPALEVKVPVGRHAEQLAAAAPALADALRVPEVRATRIMPGVVQFILVQQDPLGGALPPWPPALLPPGRCATSIRRPVPVAVAEDGTVVALELFSSSLLIGGQPGAGKSVMLWLAVLGVALDPQTQLYVIDGKGGVELGALHDYGRADGFAIDQGEAVVLMEGLLAEVLQRQRRLRALRLRKTDEAGGLFPPLVLVIDELAEVMTTGNRDLDRQAQQLLRRLLAVGRASGLTVLAATQKPSTDTVPSGVRDLIRYRVALRTGNRYSSVAILGDDPVSNGAAPHAIPPGREWAGTGYLATEVGSVKRVRSFLLSDDEVDRLCKRAASLHACATVPTVSRPG